MDKRNTNYLNGQKLTIIFQKLTTIFQKLIIVIILSINIPTYASENNKLILGLTGVTLKEDIANLINLKRYLENTTDIEISFKFTKSYASMKSLLLNNNVDFAYICGSTYVDLQETNQIELLALPVINGKAEYQSLIIVKKDSQYNNLFDLKNKFFAMSDPESNSASLVPQYIIYKKGFDFNHFFKKNIYTYDHGESIEAVLSGYVDGASVDSIVYKAFVNKNPNKANKLKIIDSFGPYPVTPFVVRRTLKNNIKLQLLNAFLNMENNRLGKQILQSMVIDKFIKPDGISYEKIKEIKQYLKEKTFYDY